MKEKRHSAIHAWLNKKQHDWMDKARGPLSKTRFIECVIQYAMENKFGYVLKSSKK